MRAWIAWLILCAIALSSSACGISGGPSGGDTKKTDEFVIKDVAVEQITDSSATVSWVTTQEAVCTASYGLEASLLPFTKSSPLGGEHEVNLSDLDEDTAYFYQVTCTNTVGGRVATQPAQFRTELSNDYSDLTAPVITSIAVEGITPTSATVTWNTDDRTNCTVLYGLDSSYGQSAPEEANSFTRTHRTVLTGLLDDQEYLFRIHAVNRAELGTFSDERSFQTAAYPTLYLDPPVIRAGTSAEFEFRVMIEDASNLAGLEYNITYPASRIEILSMRAGPYATSANGGFLFLNKNPVTNFPVIGDVSWKIVFRDGLAVGAASGSDGVIAVIRARTKNVVDEEVDLVIDTSVNAQDPDSQPKTRLLDHNRNGIPVHVRNGVIVISN
jgi:hypothetical protein